MSCTENEDIELFLSRCDSFITLNSLPKNNISKLKESIKKYKQKIIELADFADSINDNEWSHHDKFIRVLGTRTQKQKRLKLFTTNYDLAFEISASNMGMIVIDGFEYSLPYRFNPSWFHYDIVHRTNSSDKSSSYLPNIIQLYKIHGSVDWINTGKSIQKKTMTNQASEPVIIYPSSTKYQNSYKPPYLDMMSAFLEAIQKPKTAIICLGFGFNDEHINNAITMALRTNPELMLMVGTLDLFNEKKAFNSDVRTMLTGAIKAGDSRIALADCTFSDFVNHLPDRNKPTPEEEMFGKFREFINVGEKQ